MNRRDFVKFLMASPLIAKLPEAKAQKFAESISKAFPVEGEWETYAFRLHGVVQSSGSAMSVMMAFNEKGCSLYRITDNGMQFMEEHTF